MSNPTIHSASAQGDIDAVRAMLAADPAAVDAEDQYHWRPIFHAVVLRREGVLRLLLEAGADLAAHDGEVLHYAGEVPGNKAIVSLLMQYGALEAHVRPTDDLSRQFLAAVFLADAARVRSLLSQHPGLAIQLDGHGEVAIHHACRNGDTEIVRLLLDHGADVNAVTPRGHTVLYCAGGHGHLATLQLLLERGADRAACEALAKWLAQYPDDSRFLPVSAALREHLTN